MTLQTTKMRMRPSATVANTDIARVGFDRKLSLASLWFALLLIWPLIVFGRPAYYEDTVSYYKGGNAAFSFALGKLAAKAGTTAQVATVASAGPAAVAAALPIAAIAETKGARSISYSILTAALAGPSATLIPLAVLQAIILAFCATVFLRAAAAGPRLFAVTAATLAVATPAAWFSCFASPDVFAGITILVITTLGVFRERLTGWVAASLVLIGAFAVTAHSSNLALALIMLAAGLVASRQLRARLRNESNLLLLVAAPAIIGLAIVVIGGIIGFGEVSLAPKRYPLTLARSINGGAARPYLRDVCPTEHYLVCDLYGDQLSKPSGEFLWGSTGVAARATPAQMERLRTEEWQIVTRATLRYPWLELKQATRGTFDQFAAFTLTGVAFDQRLSLAQGVTLVRDPRTSPRLTAVLDVAIVGFAIMSLVYLALFYVRMSRDRRQVVACIVCGLLLNAAICAFFSAVADRYGARVIWLLPLAAAAALAQPRPAASRKATL